MSQQQKTGAEHCETLAAFQHLVKAGTGLTTKNVRDEKIKSTGRLDEGAVPSILLQRNNSQISKPTAQNQPAPQSNSTKTPLVNVLPKLTRSTLTESEEETSSSSSDGDDESSSDEEDQFNSPGTSRVLQTPTRASSPQACLACTKPFTKAGGRVVIKIGSDSEDESPIKLQSPEAYRRANNLGTAPTGGTMRVSEVKVMLDHRDLKAAHRQHRVRILEYALHYKGVTDFQITRMQAQVGEKGNWNAKFAEILGEPRKGNERDGGPLTVTDRRRRRT